MLVILESTTYPGTTEEVLKPIFEKKGYKCGKDLFLAFSPERVDPGNKYYNTKNTPKVVGGCTKDCTEIATILYENVLDSDILQVSSPSVAEMEKIFENTFRNINIALANEMAILCNRMNIDVWEVIDAAKTKPYGFMAFYPGPGRGGHCIPLDPAYLEWKAKEFNYHTRLIETASEINDFMPEFIAENIVKLLSKHKKTINGAEILMLGMAYKSDIDDYRESPVFKVIECLEKLNAEIYIDDPYINEGKYKGKCYKSVPYDDVIDKCDITVIMTAHSTYNFSEIIERSKLVYDTRNATKEAGTSSAKVYKL
jgi:UDP-N-acetyl-D-glucosamine dehydrogenase